MNVVPAVEPGVGPVVEPAVEAAWALEKVPAPYHIGPLAPGEHGVVYERLTRPARWASWRHRESPPPPFETFGEWWQRGVYQQWVLRGAAPDAGPVGVCCIHDLDPVGATAHVVATTLVEVAPATFAAACTLSLLRLFAWSHVRQVYAALSPWSDPIWADLVRAWPHATVLGRLEAYEVVAGRACDLELHLLERHRVLEVAGQLAAPLALVDLDGFAAVVAPIAGVAGFDPGARHLPVADSGVAVGRLGAVDLFARYHRLLEPSATLSQRSLADLHRALVSQVAPRAVPVS